VLVLRGSLGGDVSGKKRIFIAVAGNIGAGKTTLARLLSERFGWECHFEAVANNPYLTDFYENMDRWSFNLQVFFLNNRFRAHHNISLGESSAIQDRSIYEDAHIFARNLFEQGQMERRDYQNYLDLYNAMCHFLSPPDLIIYLRKSLPKLKEQIALRSRDYEKNIPDEYLDNLNRYYDEWMEGYQMGNKLILDSDELDFLNHDDHFDQIADEILDALGQRDLFLQSHSRSAGPLRQFQPGVSIMIGQRAQPDRELALSVMEQRRSQRNK
jgi:deoxyadenosine/deoxycytidine kinase